MTFSIIQKSQLEGAMRLDAEYFQPEFLRVETLVRKTNCFKTWGEMDGKFITGPFGSEFNVENYITDGKFRYIRGKDVKEFFLEYDDNVYVPESDFERLKKYSLFVGDILISVVGTNGNTIVIDENDLPTIFSCKSTAFRGKIDPYYLIAYLNCKYGQRQLERNARGAVQTGLNIEDLKSILIYIPNESEQSRISLQIQQSKKELKNSKSFYIQAEVILLNELGLENFESENKLFSIVDLSDCQNANRIDAEYFQPKFGEIISKIEQRNARGLGELVSMTKGFEPGSEAYQENGIPFIRVSSLSKDGIDVDGQKYLKGELFQTLKQNLQPEFGEILLTKDATPGIAYTVKESIKGIISSGILKLKLKIDIEPEYLTLCLNSIVGKMQAERDAGGSIISHWRPEQIKNILIPILPKPIQGKIAGLVRRSHSARQKSKELLNQAKRKVEEMIERGEK